MGLDGTEWNGGFEEIYVGGTANGFRQAVKRVCTQCISEQIGEHSIGCLLTLWMDDPS